MFSLGSSGLKFLDGSKVTVEKAADSVFEILKLTKYFTNILLRNDLEMISNPDFVKSVMVEGCGEDFLDPKASFNLRKYQDFGDRESCSALHLAGGASLAPSLAFFARQLLNNPGVLPTMAGVNILQ